MINDQNDIIQIKSISFQILTNKQIRTMSVIDKADKELYGISNLDLLTDGQATSGGLLDGKMGTTDPNSSCDTCGLMPSECPGHPGHIDLPEPVYHYGLLDIVKHILSCICLRCSKLLIYKNEEEIQELLKKFKKGKNRFAEIKRLCANISYCARADQNCGVPVPKIKRDTKKNQIAIQLIAETYLININAEDSALSSIDKKKKVKEIITPKMAYDILKNVSNNDYRIMGFDPSIYRPEDLIIKCFHIPPISIRPSIKMSISSTTNYEDMLTIKLLDVLKACIRIRKEKDKEIITGEEPRYMNDNQQLLQYHIATIFDNENIGLPKSEQKSGGKLIKSISERIRGKTGRIRGNLMGKRVDFSARTVITSDPNLSLDELGVPIKIAMNITFPETVTPYNIEEMKKLVKNGRYIYPGANFVTPMVAYNGQKYALDLRYRKKGIKLKPGDIVERHIIDGDPVLFNRQPSLHKLSMMCHKVKVINDSKLQTFRINVSVTSPYNADFDGDEMNFHAPQSLQTQIELKYIAAVGRHIISPRTGSIIIKLKQETVLGAYKLTKQNIPINWHDAMNYVANCKNIDYSIIKRNDATMSSHKLFSMIIPSQINVMEGDKVEINNGILTKGTITGSILNDKIITHSWDKYGQIKTKDFIDNSQQLIVNFLVQDGYTIGLGDATLPLADQKTMRLYMLEKILEIQHLLTEIENYPDLLDQYTFEKQIYYILSVAKADITKKVLSCIDKSNHFYGIIFSKAKGDDLNLGQISGGLAQSDFQEKEMRLEKRVNNRTLVHYCQHDDNADARGFIVNSYYDGLEPLEFYIHHIAGRSGLIDTAIKSIVGNTPIIIMENNNIKYINIGDWIDNLLKDNINIQLDVSTNEYRELLKLDTPVYIPSSDLHGNVEWCLITAITRHNPSILLYEIKTLNGRNVIVTDSHSLLIWNENIKQLERLSPNKVKINDYVPITVSLIEPPIIKTNILFEELSLPNNDLFNSQFELSPFNGLFLGLFISTGTINNGYIEFKITNNEILLFIQQWLDKYDIIYTTTMHTSELYYIKGYSEILSKLLSSLTEEKGTNNKHINSLCIGASNEFIMNLINGIISGNGIIEEGCIKYISQNERLLNDMNICLTRLGIFSNICNDTTLTIYGIYALLFKTTIILLNDTKQHLLLKLKPSSNLDFIEQNNIVLDKIIEINIIKSKSNALYSKVYDITVPKTLNFGLANGLHVVDTADTGYLSRKLIKGMEDIYIAYDGTVRSGNNIIIQMTYGDSNLNQVMQKLVKLNILSFGNTTIIDKYKFTDNEINELSTKLKYNTTQKQQLININETTVSKMKEFRDVLRQNQAKAKRNHMIIKEMYHQPANYQRIINDAKNSTTMTNSILDPLYIYAELDRLLDARVCRLVCLTKDEPLTSPKFYNQTKNKFLFQIALNEYLQPKRCIYEYNFNKEKFDIVIQNIISSFNNSIVEGGEMVGVVASNSLGEPLTQMSVIYDTEIYLKIVSNNEHTAQIHKIKIGEFINTFMDKNPERVKNIPSYHDSTETILTNDDYKYYICGVDNLESINWNEISHVSRHPTNGTLVKITTLSGRTITTTKSHNFLVRTKNGIVPIVAADLTTDTRIPVARQIEYKSNNMYYEYNNCNYELTELFGLYCGTYLLDTTFEHSIENAYLLKYSFNNNKNYRGAIIPTWIHNANKLFVKGFIKGFFDSNADFSIIDHSIRYCSNSKILIEDLSLLLSYFGIFATNYIIEQPYTTELLHTLQIKYNYVVIFNELIGSNSISNTTNIENIIAYSNIHTDDILDVIPEVGHLLLEIHTILNAYPAYRRQSENTGDNKYYTNWNLHKKTVIRNNIKTYITNFTTIATSLNVMNKIQLQLDTLNMIYNGDVVWDKIVSIDEIADPLTYVYDLTVPNNQTFMISNQICIHNTLNTFHSTGTSVTGMQGIPRFRELSSYSKKPNTPYMIIYMDEKNRTNKSHAHRVAFTLKFTILRELAKQLEIINEADSITRPESFYNMDDLDRESIFYLNNMASTAIDNMQWLYRITLSKEHIVENEISMLDIKSKFIKFWNHNYSDISSLKKSEKDIISKVLHGCIFTTFDSSDTLIVHIRFELSNVNNQILLGLQDILLNKFNIKGNEEITNIKKIDAATYMSYDNAENEPTQCKEWVIYTQGIDIYSIRKYIGIDINRIYCNNVHKNYLVYGIEAARASLIHELEQVFDGLSVNYAHIELLADTMTNNGGITSMDRHGINRLDTDPMGRASFEKQIEQFLLAATFNEVDYLRGVSSRIMVGRCIKGGTTLCDLIMDTDMIENSELDDTKEIKIYGNETINLQTNTFLSDLMKKTNFDNIYAPL